MKNRVPTDDVHILFLFLVLRQAHDWNEGQEEDSGWSKAPHRKERVEWGMIAQVEGHADA